MRLATFHLPNYNHSKELNNILNLYLHFYVTGVTQTSICANLIVMELSEMAVNGYRRWIGDRKFI